MSALADQKGRPRNRSSEGRVDRFESVPLSHGWNRRHDNGTDGGTSNADELCKHNERQGQSSMSKSEQ